MGRSGSQLAKALNAAMGGGFDIPFLTTSQVNCRLLNLYGYVSTASIILSAAYIA